MEVTHPRWRVRGQRQRSPAAASTILHLHNNHTLEENRRCGNYNQQPTRGTQPHTILHLHNNRCGLSYQQPATGTIKNKPQLTTIQRLHHPPQQPHPGADMEMWQVQSTTNHWHRASLTLSVTLFFITLSNNHTLEDTSRGEQQK